MVNAANVAAAIVSFLALALIAVAMATNSWIRIDYPRSSLPEAATINPPVINSDLDGMRLRYDLDYFGLWVGCHREQSFNKISCGFITSTCYSTICWTRDRKEKTCKTDRVGAISNCAAYRTTRAFAILGIICLVFGAAILLVTTCVMSRNLIWIGAFLTGLSALFAMIAFAVFYLSIFKQGDLDDIGAVAWSFIMLIVSWPLATLATLVSIIGALSTPAKSYGQDDSE